MIKRLYIMRHAEALSAQENPERPLSELGVEHAKKMAAWLKAVNIPIQTILHSSVLRAEQTAAIVAEKLNITPRAFEPLHTDASLVALASSIGELESNTLLVGHLPNLDYLSNLLITYDEHCTTLSFLPCAIAAYALTENSCTMEWFVYPDLIIEKPILLY